MSKRSQTKSARRTERAVHATEEITSRPLPIAARILLAFAVAVAVIYIGRIWITPINNYDLWFHVKTGQWIFNHHRLPAGDIFSADSAGREWIVNAWLSSILLWAACALGGPNAIILGVGLIALITFGMIGLACYRISGKPILSVTVAFLSLASGGYRFTPRPEIFSLILMAVMLVVLFQYKFRRTDHILWLIPLGALWPNLHMGFTTIPVVLGCFVVGDWMVSAYCTQGRKPVPENVVSGKRLTRLAWVALGMMAATLINPYGPRAWTFVTRISSFMADIPEWSPLLGMLNSLNPVCVGTLTLLAIFAFSSLVLSRRAQDVVGLFLLVAFGALALKFMRQSVAFSLIAPLVAASAARGLRLPTRWARRISHPTSAVLGAFSILALDTAILLALVVWGFPLLTALNWFGLGLDKAKFGDRPMEFIRENGLLGERLFNTLESGGWLIWKLGPEQKVYIDGRVDMYGHEAFLQYGELISSTDAGERLKAQGIDYCYFRYPKGKESGAVPYAAITLTRQPDWPLVFFDDSAMIYVRREPRNARVIAKHEYRYLSPVVPSGAEIAAAALHPREVLDEVSRIQKECPDSAWGHLSAAEALLGLGRFVEAGRQLDLARGLARHWGDEMMIMLEERSASASAGAGDHGKACSHLREAARLCKDDPAGRKMAAQIRNNLGIELIESKQYPEAEAELRKALELDPEALLARVNLGHALTKQRKLTEAVRVLEQCVSQTPDMINGHIVLAMAYTLTQKPKDALEQLEFAAGINPSVTASAMQESEFDSLRGNPRFKALGRR